MLVLMRMRGKKKRAAEARVAFEAHECVGEAARGDGFFVRAITKAILTITTATLTATATAMTTASAIPTATLTATAMTIAVPIAGADPRAIARLREVRDRRLPRCERHFEATVEGDRRRRQRARQRERQLLL